MADKTTKVNTLKQLRAENAQLKRENKRLTEQTTQQKGTRKAPKAWGRSFGAAFFIALATALLVAGNLLFWAGNTVVKPDRFASTVEPIIKNEAVQNAIAAKTTESLFNNIDTESVVQEALPPRAEFLAPTIADQLQQRTQDTLKTALSKPQVQDAWNTVLTGAHERFIASAEKHGADGAIDISEFYQELSNTLRDTKLGFLADKPLPSKVGSITIAQNDQLAVLNRVITKIDTWRTLTVLLFVISCGVAIWLSRRHRRGVIRLSAFLAAGMFTTLVALRITREMIADKVDPSYSEAARETVQIIFHPLVVQTATLMAAFLVIAFVAWIAGPSKVAVAARDKLHDLLNGNIHGALFTKENDFTRWLGAHKRVVQWAVVAIVAIVVLSIRLTPMVLVSSIAALVLLIGAIEVLAAPHHPHKAK